ncbi:tRNA (adenosine(37)-N6)-threonylcarbamoyltransferase complex dimerization subunit type 1 TsaB [Microbacterium suaedae]|uniref:tRNA (adenosine(37)-N6)-threonylcarbamoyltransferase complex dimerization subunit type 1 TsaB n=1 Tax=Microbacterium suaedae TaxID=2067813 RepID=UPI000DAF10E9|nr:tRNA (adenosine(37)-N6)-threonylcarbamoyltransferase complex dimerization subunit type 1 TsaB [Microbacterium suaedae]
MILAIDSSLGSSVAVVDPATEDVCAQADSEGTRGHAEVIGTLLERALAEAGAVPADITHVAVGMGPGPFTGLRIGIAAARAFATGRGIPVVPVVSHDAAALERQTDGRFSVVTDARRRENAVSTYEGSDDGIPRRVSGPVLVPQPRAEDLTNTRDSEGSGEGVSTPARTQNLSAPDPAAGAPLGEVVHARSIAAGAIGILAARMLRAGRIPEIGEPLYLRAPDAKLPGPVKRVST